MAKPVSHLLDIYSTWLHLATDEKGWTKLQEQHDRSIVKADALGSTTFATFHPHQAGATVPHVFLYVDLEAHRGVDVALVETCAHEAAHAATHILRYVGHRIRRHDEPFAYLVAFIAQWMYGTCSKRMTG